MKNSQKKHKISATKWTTQDNREQGVVFWYKDNGRLTFDIYTSLADAVLAAKKEATNINQVLKVIGESFSEYSCAN